MKKQQSAAFKALLVPIKYASSTEWSCQ